MPIISRRYARRMSPLCDPCGNDLLMDASDSCSVSAARGLEPWEVEALGVSFA